MIKMLTIFTGARWGELLFFLDELNILVAAKATYFKIMNLATGEYWDFKIRYTDHFIACPKHEAIFFISNRLHNKNKIYIYIMDLQTTEYRSAIIPARNGFGFMSAFLSENGNSVNIIHSSGDVFVVDIKTFEMRQVMALHSKIDRSYWCYTMYGALYLPFRWENKGGNVYEYVVFNGKESARLQLDVTNQTFSFLPISVFKESQKGTIIQGWLYWKKIDIWMYYTNIFPEDTKNIKTYKVIFEFQKSDKKLCAFEMVCSRENFFKNPKTLGENHAVVFNGGCLYLFDLEKQSFSKLKFEDKVIMDVFVYEKIKSVLPVFLEGRTKRFYIIDDFELMAEQPFQIY